MDDGNDEDDFLDDAFDALPPNTLENLERDAISLSQHPNHGYQSGSRYAAPGYTAAPYQPAVYDRSQYLRADESNPEPPSSDYGLDDADVIDLDEPMRFVDPPSSKFAAQSAIRDRYQASESRDRPLESMSDVGDLRARLVELERERSNLQKTVEEARSDAMSKAGAVSILRSKHDKATKEYERKLSVLQSLHADEIAKHKADIEAARKERETMKTSNLFLQHDLAQEAERSKRLRGTAANASGKASSQNGNRRTPQKTTSFAYRDGFDDDEVIYFSPSKTKDKPNAETPKAGAKRKRPVDGSPAVALPLREVRPSPRSDIAKPVAAPEIDTALYTKLDVQRRNLRIMQRIMNHCYGPSKERTIERLAGYAFLSEPEVPISGIVLQHLSRSGHEDDVLSLRICSVCLDLWSRCIEAKYYDPLLLLIDLLEFVLLQIPTSSQITTVDRFVPIAIKTIDLVAVPLARSAMNPPKAKTEDTAESSSPLNAGPVLDILHLLAMGASLDAPTTEDFWSRMEPDFVLVMLNKAQPLSQIVLVLQMIGASVRADGFGTADQDPEVQGRNEKNTIDRLTSLFFDFPDTPQDDLPRKASEIATSRIEILQSLGAICLTEHGSIALAQHRNAIGRLVRFLDAQINALYSLPPGGDLAHLTDSDKRTESLHDLTITSINLTTRLLYHLLHNHAQSINLRDKLVVIHGGQQKFLVAFTRLAFSEQTVFEAGLDEDVIDAAHEILDAVMTPEEGEAIVQAVETPRGSHASRVLMPAASAPD